MQKDSPTGQDVRELWVQAGERGGLQEVTKDIRKRFCGDNSESNIACQECPFHRSRPRTFCALPWYP